MPTGKRIKEIRMQKGLTQKQLGDKCGIADANIRKYENGKQNPKMETLQKIADALGVPIYEFLDNDLFDATLHLGSYEGRFFNDKVKEIVNDTTLSETEMKKKLSDLSMQGMILTEFHRNDLDTRTKEILNNFVDQLNENGQNKAIEQVQMLTKIPEYRKDTNPDSDIIPFD